MSDLLSSRQKLAFACFACRTVSKRPAPFYYHEFPHLFEHGQNSPKLAFFCPRCGGPEQFVGRYFKPPPRRALAQWRKAEALWRAGWRADGYNQRGLSIGTLCQARNYPEQRREQERVLVAREQRTRSQQRWKRALHRM